MIIPVIALVTTVALALGVVNTGLNFKTIYDIEMDRHFIAATEQQLAEQSEKVAEKLEEARQRNDVLAAAEYETMLSDIRLIRDRSNVAAIGRQVEQQKTAFIEEQWSVFVADQATNLVSWGMGKVGFGNVSGRFMRGSGWPVGKNILTWDPVAKQAERVILGSSPDLVAIQFSDELGEFMSAILNGFDVARSVTANQDIQSAQEASTYVSGQLDEVENMRPLPADIGDYLAASLVKKVKRQNPQIASESLVEQAVFVRQQACQQLKDLWLNEQGDQHRAEALRAALDKLECDKIAGDAAPADDSAETVEEPAAPSDSIPVTDEPAPPSEVAATTEEPVPSGESGSPSGGSDSPGGQMPGDPCVFMPPGIAITQKDQAQCVGEYSVEPYIAVTIAVMEEGTDTQKMCNIHLEDEYSLIMEEVNLGDCGFKLLFSHFEPVDAASYDGWGIEFLVDRVMVNVYTFDVYPNSEGWIQATAAEIEEKIVLQLSP